MAKIEFAKKVEVATLSDLTVGIGYRLNVAGEEIALFKLNDGSVRAIENCSPFKKGPLSEGIVSGEFVFCPMRDWKISLTDGQVQAPDHGSVKTYSVEVEGETIYVHLD